ncbi:phage terminase small subunit P27 family [Maritimibacter sp. 55A14]|nr:phage terminase small subunit P27 family [Maritimibacter sp. 55A14]
MEALPRCPAHLSEVAHKEWRRLATPMHEAGILTLADRAALAAYCQAWARWVEAEEKLAATPALLKTPNGHVQQSPWLTVANKQMELMSRYMSELGLTPVARTRLANAGDQLPAEKPTIIQIVSAWPDGTMRDQQGEIVEHEPEEHVIQLDDRI